MTSMSSRKEDLQYRMADLLQQLAQSEEERKKLEKTCHMLIRAFKEEEKLHYKALENKYEKFMEDCKVRRRRNDMILRSIHRVEDRARALHNKTERLKVLKNRYINYLRPLELRKNEPNTERISSSASSKSLTLDKETPKSVHWRVPNVSEFFVHPQVRSSSVANISKYLRYEGFDDPDKPLESENYSDFPMREGNEGGVIKNNNVFNEYKENKQGKELDYPESLLKEKQTLPLSSQEEKVMKNEIAQESLGCEKISKNETVREGLNNGQFNKNEISNVKETSEIFVIKENSRETRTKKTDFKPELDKTQIASELKERSIIKHQKSIEKLKSALSIEDFSDAKINSEKNEQIIEKDEIENNEKTDSISNAFIKHYNEDANDENFGGEEFEDEINEIRDEGKKVVKELPKGLDGIDYENETYPESYYEQPVRQNNYSSIASNVILEEDEPEVDQLETPFIHHKNENFGLSSPSCQSVAESPGGRKEAGAEGSVEVTSSNSPSDKIEGQVSGVETKQNPLKHLLESDSESFQIEHGDVASVNDDSDFDFSFNQN